MPAATEGEIAAAVDDLLYRAHRGPDQPPGRKLAKVDRKVAARTRATTGPAWPRQPEAPAPADTRPDQEPPQEPEPPVAVEAFEMFDPYQEAQRRW